MRFIYLLLILLLLHTPSIPVSSADSSCLKWNHLQPSSTPDPRFHHSMVWNTDQQKLILFGGNSDGTIDDSTWAYDPFTNEWINRNPTNPPPGLNYHAMAYDSVNKKTILFGGVRSAPSILQNYTYAYDYASNSWTQMEPDNAPLPRRSPNMVYDEVNDRVVLFGGRAQLPQGGIESVADTWTYSYNTNTWKEINTSTQPTQRSVPAMVYDSIQEQVILVGGTDGYHAGFTTDTWIFNITRDDWELVNLTSFDYLGEFDLTFDPGLNLVILYGGYDRNTPSDELYIFSPKSRTWRQMKNFTNGPGAWITEMAMVFDTAHNQTIFFGGSPDDVPRTWSLQLDRDFDLDTCTSSYEIDDPVIPTSRNINTDSGKENTTDTSSTGNSSLLLLTMIVTASILLKYRRVTGTSKKQLS